MPPSKIPNSHGFGEHANIANTTVFGQTHLNNVFSVINSFDQAGFLVLVNKYFPTFNLAITQERVCGCNACGEQAKCHSECKNAFQLSVSIVKN